MTGTASVGDSATDELLPNPQHRPTLTVEQAGRVLGLSRQSAYEAAKTGQLPTIRIGRRLLVPTAALRRMLGFDS